MSKKAFSLRKLAIMAAAASGFLAAAPVFAASETAPVPGMAPGATVGSEQECDMGPGMMGGHGQGHGMGPGAMGGHAQGHGMGPGMMGGHGQGHGMGSGTMGGHGQGHGKGPGMMGGYAQGCGMGPGTMAGHAQGHGMGPGMMGGHGQGCDMGPGMMGGHAQGHGFGMMRGYSPAYAAGAIASLDLSAEQRDKIYKIQDDTRQRQWALMGKARDAQIRLSRLFDADTPDDAAMSKGYKQLSELRQQMFDNSLAARKQLEAVLSKEQRAQLRRSGYGRRAY